MSKDKQPIVLNVKEVLNTYMTGVNLALTQLTEEQRNLVMEFARKAAAEDDCGVAANLALRVMESDWEIDPLDLIMFATVLGRLMRANGGAFDGLILDQVQHNNSKEIH